MTEGNMVLYGIQTEQSDIRAHVSVVHRCIYVFETWCGLQAIQNHNPRYVNARQPGVDYVTAIGYLVDPDWIEGLQCVHYDDCPAWQEFHTTMSTSEKGDLAVRVVTDCMRDGLFPFRVDVDQTNCPELQFSGTDLVVSMQTKVQVKCDWKAGPKPEGTGHLFLQVAERNPLSSH